MKDHPTPDIGQIATLNDVLFCRDLVAEAVFPHYFTTWPGALLAPTIDKLLKCMIIFELHGLMDCAVDLAQYYRTQLAARIDVDEAIERLIYRPLNTRQTVDVAECMRMIGDLRLHVAELNGRIAYRESTKALATRLVQRLATAPGGF